MSKIIPRTVDPPNPIYIFKDYTGDILHAVVEVYELDHENATTLFLKQRAAVVQFRKGKQRANALSGPDPWFRTLEEVQIFWNKEVAWQIQTTERRLQELKNMVEIEFHQIPNNV